MTSRSRPELMKADMGELTGYSDTDWEGDIDDRHLTIGNLFIMAGAPVSWLSLKQAIVHLRQSM